MKEVVAQGCIVVCYDKDVHWPLVERFLSELRTKIVKFEWRIDVDNPATRLQFLEDSSTIAVVAFLSEHTLETKTGCIKEFQKAALLGCPFIPVLLEEEKYLSIPSYLVRTQWLDLQRDSAEKDPKWLNEKLGVFERCIEKIEADREEAEQLCGLLHQKEHLRTLEGFEKTLRKYPFIGRGWVINRIEQWMSKEDSQPVFCIKAPIGFGKTRLSEQVRCAYAPQVLATVFSDAERLSTREAILLIAAQIGKRLPAYRSFLLSHRIDYQKLSDQDLFRTFFLEATSCGIDGNIGSQLVIVDGADSLPTGFLKQLSLQQDGLPRWLKFLVTVGNEYQEVNSYVEALFPFKVANLSTDHQKDLTEILGELLGSCSDKQKAFLIETTEGNVSAIHHLLSKAALDSWMAAPKKARTEVEKYLRQAIEAKRPITEDDQLSSPAPTLLNRGADTDVLRVFFSYGHDRNAVFVERLKEEIERIDPACHVWFDKNDITVGDDWRTAIYDGIHNSQAVVAWLSKHSVRDPGVCLDELRIAVGERSVKLASVLLEAPEAVMPPISISHIDYLDMSRWEDMKSRGETVFSDWVHAKAKELYAVVREGKEQAGELSTIKEKLGIHHLTGGFVDRIQQLLRQGFVGRQWLVDRINKWLLSEGAGKVFCLTGGPGFGKSALMAWLASQNKVQILGVHFCSAGSCLDAPEEVIKSLAFQIATRFPAYRKFLLELKTDLTKESAKGLFKELITNATGSEVAEGGRYAFIVDGLDEAPEELTRLLVEMADEAPEWLRFIVSSRPNERHLEESLKRLKPFFVSADDERNIKDAALFVQGWLKVANVPSSCFEYLSTKLLKASEGNFRYLVMLKSSVDNGVFQLSDFFKEQVQFPSNLSSLYETHLERLYGASSQNNQQLAHVLLSMLSVIGDALPKTTLIAASESLGYEDVAVSKELDHLGSLICTTETAVQLHHKSVKDWLVSGNSGVWFVDVTAASRVAVRAILRVLFNLPKQETKMELEIRGENLANLAHLVLRYLYRQQTAGALLSIHLKKKEIEEFLGLENETDATVLAANATHDLPKDERMSALIDLLLDNIRNAESPYSASRKNLTYICYGLARDYFGKRSLLTLHAICHVAEYVQDDDPENLFYGIFEEAYKVVRTLTEKKPLIDVDEVIGLRALYTMLLRHWLLDGVQAYKWTKEYLFWFEHNVPATTSEYEENTLEAYQLLASACVRVLEDESSESSSFYVDNNLETVGRKYAEKFLKKAEEVYSKEHEFYLYYGNEYISIIRDMGFATKRTKDKMQELTDLARRLFGEDTAQFAEQLRMQADFLMSYGEIESGVSCYNKGLDILRRISPFEDLYSYLEDYALALEGKRMYAEAVGIREEQLVLVGRVVSTWSSASEVFINLAQDYQGIGDLNGAEETMEKGVQLYDKNLPSSEGALRAKEKFAEILFEQGKYSQALEVFRSILSLAERQERYLVEIQAGIANCLFGLSRAQEGLDSLIASVQQRFVLGTCCNRYGQVRELVERCLRSLHKADSEKVASFITALVKQIEHAEGMEDADDEELSNFLMEQSLSISVCATTLCFIGQWSACWRLSKKYFGQWKEADVLNQEEIWIFGFCMMVSAYHLGRFDDCIGVCKRMEKIHRKFSADSDAWFEESQESRPCSEEEDVLAQQLNREDEELSDKEMHDAVDAILNHSDEGDDICVEKLFEGEQTEGGCLMSILESCLPDDEDEDASFRRPIRMHLLGQVVIALAQSNLALGNEAASKEACLLFDYLWERGSFKAFYPWDSQGTQTVVEIYKKVTGMETGRES